MKLPGKQIHLRTSLLKPYRKVYLSLYDLLEYALYNHIESTTSLPLIRFFWTNTRAIYMELYEIDIEDTL